MWTRIWDSDTDSDTDSDMDSNMDSDMDSNTDSDVDSDMDSDMDSDVDSESMDSPGVGSPGPASAVDNEIKNLKEINLLSIRPHREVAGP
jgi:hypothetical protein